MHLHRSPFCIIFVDNNNNKLIRPIQVRIQCTVCRDYDLCVPCFSEGRSTRDHNPQTHPFHVIEQHSIPIFTEDWGADEELLLLEGAEMYGMGSWGDIANHIGGFRSKEEVRDHYIETYINSPNFPLPERADPADTRLSDSIPRDEFQVRKKRRIEECKEALKNAPPTVPKQKPTASVPSCHEVQGYMPGRLEFETEHLNDAEEVVQHMQFEPGDGINPVTGELEPEMELKMTMMEIYNAKLTARADRKRTIFGHNLLEYRKNTAWEKKKTKEERELFHKVKPFARTMNHEDFEEFYRGLEYEHNLRIAIQQLQEWRRMQITDLRSGERYEIEKAQRKSRGPPLSLFDRMSSSRVSKPLQAAADPASRAVAFLAPDYTPTARTPSTLPTATTPAIPDPPTPPQKMASVCTNPKIRIPVTPLPDNVPNGSAPLVLSDDGSVPDLHLLTPDERNLCSVLRLRPKPYIALKEMIVAEAARQGGYLTCETVCNLSKVDASKGSRLFDFFVRCGWVGKAVS